jgi:LPS sulfotransferase NodH
MSRDIEDRLWLMSGGRVEVRRIALNMDQVEQYDPPPNFAKITDSRARDYIERYGEDSWELDALEPAVLTSLVQDEIRPLIDQDAWGAAEAHQEENAERIRTIADRWADIEAAWDDVLAVIGE